MDSKDFNNITFSNFKWLNEPREWEASKELLEFSTDDKTDFWQKTLYDFAYNTGHLFGVEIREDFTVEICIEADFTTLYDQAGLMIYIDEQHWLKTGIEYNDGQPMIGSVLTNGISDWGTGVYLGNANKFFLRLTRLGDVVCVKYSTDSVTWILVRLCPFPIADKYFVGPMACTPKRGGLAVKFSKLKFTKPAEDILHSN
ncbi:hypothetical protein MSG28_015586 [Choristoneura fumiferana]|uniref:Uncharacterized protein n=1 Tax=Choristoneura fumiferana TaxID=7141 RepID=A0ACC0KBD6_CHOFU|nr:hypothetical protein MSG28_015586 [Choristoneura fumiferana]